MNRKEKDREIVKQYNKEKPWGMSTCIDLLGCNSETIRDAKKIKKFVNELCQLIDMKKFGKTTVVNFGEDLRIAGFSMTQLIETSLISGHFANNSHAAYLDIFSCKEYSPYQTAKFCQEFFEAKSCKIKVNFRF